MMKSNDKLRRARELKGWSQRRLAEAVGTYEGRISMWEAGAPVGKQFQAKMCELFEKDAEELGFIRSVSIVSEEDSSSMLPLGMTQGILVRATHTIGELDFYMLQRRSFLQYLFALTGSTFVPFVGLHEPAPKMIEALLPEVQEIIASCWRLLRGKDISVVPSLLIMWLPMLDVLIKYPSKHQQALMNLTAQGYIIAGIAVSLRQNAGGAEWCSIQAVEYARLAEDRNLEAAALKHLASKYMYVKMPLQTLRTYQETLPIVDQLTPLLKSRTYLGLALAYAQCEQQKEAERYLGMAYDTFPDDHQKDPCFTYADCGLSSLNHYGGLIYLLFGQAQKATDTFAEVDAMKKTVAIPERTVLEIKNCQAEAAIANHDKEQARECLKAGVTWALELQSKRRFEESFAAYQKARKCWPDDKQLQQLEDLYEQGKEF